MYQVFLCLTLKEDLSSFLYPLILDNFETLFGNRSEDLYPLLQKKKKIVQATLASLQTSGLHGKSILTRKSHFFLEQALPTPCKEEPSEQNRKDLAYFKRKLIYYYWPKFTISPGA